MKFILASDARNQIETIVVDVVPVNFRRRILIFLNLLLAAALILPLKAAQAERTFPAFMPPRAPFVPEKALAAYNVVYLAPANISPQSLVAPDKVAAWGARYVTDWQSVVQSDIDRPLDAVIIHRDAASLIDRGWLRQRYRSGLVVAGINLWMRDLAEILAYPRITMSPWPAAPWWDSVQEVPFFSISYSFTYDRGSSEGGSNDAIWNGDGLRFFIFQLKSELQSMVAVRDEACNCVVPRFGYR